MNFNRFFKYLNVFTLGIAQTNLKSRYDPRFITKSYKVKKNNNLRQIISLKIRVKIFDKEFYFYYNVCSNCNNKLLNLN